MFFVFRPFPKFWVNPARTKMEWWSASKEDASHHYDQSCMEWSADALPNSIQIMVKRTNHSWFHVMRFIFFLSLLLVSSQRCTSYLAVLIFVISVCAIPCVILNFALTMLLYLIQGNFKKHGHHSQFRLPNVEFRIAFASSDFVAAWWTGFAFKILVLR